MLSAFEPSYSCFRSPFGLKRLIETAVVGLPWFKNFRPNNFASHPFGRFALGKFLFYGQIITRISYIFGYISNNHIHFFVKKIKLTKIVIGFILLQDLKDYEYG